MVVHGETLPLPSDSWNSLQSAGKSRYRKWMNEWFWNSSCIPTVTMSPIHKPRSCQTRTSFDHFKNVSHHACHSCKPTLGQGCKLFRTKTTESTPCAHFSFEFSPVVLNCRCQADVCSHPLNVTAVAAHVRVTARPHLAKTPAWARCRHRWHECKCDLSFFFLQLRWFMRRGKAWQECADHSVPRCLSLRLHWVNNCGEGEKTGRWMNAGMNEWMDEGVNEWDGANVVWLSYSTPAGLFVCRWPIICWNNNRASHFFFKSLKLSQTNYFILIIHYSYYFIRAFQIALRPDVGSVFDYHLHPFSLSPHWPSVVIMTFSATFLPYFLNLRNGVGVCSVRRSQGEAPRWASCQVHCVVVFLFPFSFFVPVARWDPPLPNHGSQPKIFPLTTNDARVAATNA